jgi:hypothetical protein
VDGQKIIEMGQRRNGGVPQKESAVRHVVICGTEDGRKQHICVCCWQKFIKREQSKQLCFLLLTCRLGFPISREMEFPGKAGIEVSFPEKARDPGKQALPHKRSEKT